MENKYSKILVAVDGSKQAEWAFKNAVAIAQRNEDAELYIASVIDATIATSGLTGFKRMLMGSVSEGIVRYAKSDVIIIKQRSIQRISKQLSLKNSKKNKKNKHL